MTKTAPPQGVPRRKQLGYCIHFVLSPEKEAWPPLSSNGDASSRIYSIKLI